MTTREQIPLWRSTYEQTNFPLRFIPIDPATQKELYNIYLYANGGNSSFYTVQEAREKGLFHPELSLHLFCNCNIFKKPRLIVSTTHSAYGFACYCSKCTARVGLDTRVISEPNFLLDAEMIRVLSVPVDTFQRALNYVPELLSVLALSPDLEVRLSAITAPNLCVDTINHMLTSMYSVLDVNPLQSSLRPTSSRILTFSLSRIRFREKSAEGTSKGISGKLESIILELWKLGIMPFISTKENYMVLTAFV